MQSANSATRQSRAREIYNQAPPQVAQSSSRRRSSSLTKAKKPRAAKGRKRAQPGQGNSVMLNNYFPALNQQDEGMTNEELAALQLQQAMLMRGEQEQVINEAMPEEEAESQEVTQSRKVHHQYDMAPQAEEQEMLLSEQVVQMEDEDQEEPAQVMANGLSEEQLVELLQHADQLSEEQQA